MRIDQIAKWQQLITDDMNLNELLSNLEFRCRVVSIFRDITISKARSADVEDVIRISNHYIEKLASYEKKQPAERIEIDGKTFVFNTNRNAWKTGQIIDLKMLPIETIINEPQKMLAIMYIEEGMTYCQEVDGVVVNPNTDREELFRMHFPWQELLNFQGFFLHNLEQRKIAIMAIQTARMIAVMKKQQMTGSRGRRYSFNWLKTLIQRLTASLRKRG